MHTAASFATALFHNFCRLSNFYTFARFFVLRHFHNSSTDFSTKSARNTFVFSVSKLIPHNPCALLSKTGFFYSIFRGCYNHFCFKDDQTPLKSAILRFKESTAASISCRVVSFPSVMRTVPAAYSFGTPSASIT